MRCSIKHLAQCLRHDKHSRCGPFPVLVVEGINGPEFRPELELCPLNTDYLRVCVRVVMKIKQKRASKASGRKPGPESRVTANS